MSKKIELIPDNGENKPLKPGQKETMLSFESATRKNILMIVQHGNETRKIVRANTEEIKVLRNIISMQDEKIDRLRNMIVQGLQNKVSGGSTQEDKE